LAHKYSTLAYYFVDIDMVDLAKEFMELSIRIALTYSDEFDKNVFLI